LKKTDEDEAEQVGKRARIMKAMRALKLALDEGDSTAKKAKRADDDELDDEDTALDDEELEDDAETDEDDLGGAPRGKKARRAKKADDDELDDDELDEDEAKRAYDDDTLYSRSEMQKFEPGSHQANIRRIKDSDVVSGRELVSRAKTIALREGLKWRTLSGREEAILLAAKELRYRGPRV
jgi:hypothetical protein